MAVDWWRRFFDSSKVDGIEQNRKKLALYATSLLGSAVMFWFAFNTPSASFVLFSLLLACATFVLLNACIAIFLDRLNFACNFASVCIFILLIGLAYTGGYANTALYWMFPFPIVFFILLSYKLGLLLNILLFSCIFLMINVAAFNQANYEPAAIIRFEVSIVLTVLFAFMSEFVRSRSHRELVSINIEKQRLANTDQLTKLPNRHFLASLDFSATGEFAQDGKFPLAVVMADIDLFKSVNDRYGHDVGDRVLCHLADFFKLHIRSSDIIIRMGGEEFMLFFVNTGVEPARAICDKLNRLLSDSPYCEAGDVIKISLSFGIAIANSGEQLSKATKDADKMLYLAKDNGRARVEIFQSQ